MITGQKCSAPPLWSGVKSKSLTNNPAENPSRSGLRNTDADNIIPISDINNAVIDDNRCLPISIYAKKSYLILSRCLIILYLHTCVACQACLLFHDRGFLQNLTMHVKQQLSTLVACFYLFLLRFFCVRCHFVHLPLEHILQPLAW